MVTRLLCGDGGSAHSGLICSVIVLGNDRKSILIDKQTCALSATVAFRDNFQQLFDTVKSCQLLLQLLVLFPTNESLHIIEINFSGRGLCVK